MAAGSGISGTIVSIQGNPSTSMTAVLSMVIVESTVRRRVPLAYRECSDRGR